MRLRYILIILLPLIICGCTKKEEPKKIPEYDSDIKCVSTIEEDNDGDLVLYTSNIYINIDDNNNVTNTIYQSISDSTALDKATVDLTNQFLDIYKDINGIEAEAATIDNKLVITIKYDYTNMDLNIVKKKLGSILEDDNILKKTNKLPFSYDEFKKYSLKGYECK
jgi:uncharacterized lipoprotein YehR (DUF1307 family)